MRDVCRRILVLTASLCVFAGCEDQETGNILDDGTEVTWPDEESAVPRDADTYVCDPVITDPDQNSSHSSNSRQGIIANLFYLAGDAPSYSSVNDYIEFGETFEGIDIYFNQMNIPTRPFDRGFVTEGGTTLMTPDGDTLYEWFALEFRGQIQLRDDQTAGDYQFGLLSDDGAILEFDFDGDGEYETLIDNDHDHATKMACATDAVTFETGTTYNYRLRYYQGPRYHISLVVMMRPYPENPSDVVDSECGMSGNNRYFDSSQTPPEPQSAYLGLLDRGWAPLAPQNYLLQSSDEDNPCDDVPAPVLSGLSVSKVTTSSATVSWTSDIVSTSQVQIFDVLAGTTVYTTENSNMVTAHDVVISGLSSNRLYRVVGISKSSSGLSSSTSSLDFRTSR